MMPYLAAAINFNVEMELLFRKVSLQKHVWHLSKNKLYFKK